MSDGRTRTLIVGIVAVLVLLLDQATKSAVEHTMTLGESIPLMPVLSLTYVRNPGAAFGMLTGVPAVVRYPFLLGITAVALVVLVQLARETPARHRGTLVAIGAVVGGAAGNLVCRIRYGEVVDFIHLHWGAWYWPMFNLADSAITVGAITIAISSLLTDRAPRPSL